MATEQALSPELQGAATLIAPLPQHAFDADALWKYLQEELPGFAGPASLQQFQGGQSNPTFLITTPGANYVLRKKPGGTLLPSAHQIEREYRVLRALQEDVVPVPRAFLLCEDTSVIGTAFFVMQHIEGRNFRDPGLPALSPADRGATYDDFITVLAALHRVDWRARGLEGFGRPENYVSRQLKRWSAQYQSSRTADDPAMNQLIPWLERNIPTADESCIVHGDFRLGNLLVHPKQPRIVAVLDWELATLGHPLCDLAYACMSYRIASRGYTTGLAGLDLGALGIPSESEFLERYCRRVGRTGIPDWSFFLAFSFFRSAAIAQGVYARALAGNAADRRGIELGEAARAAAAMGWQIASGH